MDMAQGTNWCRVVTTALLLTSMVLAAGSLSAARAMEPPGRAAGEAGASGAPQPPSRRPPAAPVGSIIIKYKETAVRQALAPRAMEEAMINALRSVSERAGVALTHGYVIGGGAQVARLEEPVSREYAKEIAGNVASEQDVEYAEPNFILTIQGAPNDRFYPDQWHYHEPPASVDVAGTWALTSGAGVVVAIVDTGIVAHADLEGQVLPGYDMIANPWIARDDDGRDADASDPGDWAEPGDFCYFDGYEPYNYSSWHGTHVAGTVAAVTGNGIGVAGVAWSAKILPVRVLGRCGGTLADIADGIRWAAGLDVPDVPRNDNPAQVINLSLSASQSCGNTFQNAISDAVDTGATVVVAAGNSADDVKYHSPANCEDVVTVSALTRTGYLAGYSNYGDAVDMAAPGGDTLFDAANGVLSTLNTGHQGPEEDTYVFYEGTSMAAPHVSGVAALLYALNPRTTPAQVAVALKRGSRDFVVNCSGCGAGMLDAPNALLTGRLARRLPVKVLFER